MATTEPTTHTSVAQKLRSKQLAHMRFGSPKLRDLLREKCRIRLRESRVGSFDQQRGPMPILTDDDRRTLIGTVIQDELRELNLDLELQEQIAAELSEEAFAWFLDDRDNREAEFVEQLMDTAGAPFFCPICQTTILQLVFDHHMCSKCALRFRSGGGAPPQLQIDLLRKLAEHEQRDYCAATVVFFAEPIADSHISSLSMFCDGCDFYATFRPSEC